MKYIFCFISVYTILIFSCSCNSLSDKGKNLQPVSIVTNDSAMLSKTDTESSLLEPLYLPVNGSVSITKLSYGCFYYSREIMRISRTVDSFHVMINYENANGDTLDSLKKSFGKSLRQHLVEFCEFYKKVLNDHKTRKSEIKTISTSAKYFFIKNGLCPVEIKDISEEELWGYENLKLAVQSLSLKDNLKYSDSRN